MRKQVLVAFGSIVLGFGLVGQIDLAGQAPSPGSAQATLLPADSQRALVEEYCVGCHNPAVFEGQLSLMEWDLAHVEDDPEVGEKVVRKLRAGLMPPPGAPRPERETLSNLAASLENSLDRADASNPNPGPRALARLNRAEYARSVEDFLGLEMDVGALLPPDTMGQGFDNSADSLTVSPILIEGYMRAAGEISRAAIGDRNAAPTSVTYKVPRTSSQMRHVDGAPFGTRGGIVVNYNFPADGEYVFKLTMYGGAAGRIFGLNNPLAGDDDVATEQLEVSIDGERGTVVEINSEMRESSTGLTLTSDPVFVYAGPHRVAASFIEKFSGMVDDLIAPIEHTQADSEITNGSGVTVLPHLQDLSITGPFKVTGVSQTVSRTRIFKCRPTLPEEELSCARDIVSDLASEAYRRPASDEDMEGLMNFYLQGRDAGDFESGIRTALQAILASPAFVFRFEEQPEGVAPGEDYRIGGVELATRLSYFLWSSVPDQELLAVANDGRLHEPDVLEQQMRRMLESPRAEALATRFASQWLHLQDLDGFVPDPLLFPQFDTTMGQSMKRETEMLFDSIVREDRSVMDLLTADYTFVDDRLAKHYKIPNIIGTRFRRVPVTDENRKGILGHGSILTLTSNADRTSPVMRGKFVMEVLLGSPPPTPPPNVPELEETGRLTSARVLTVRERMEEHRANPFCNACHQMIDPIGLALENFDPTGRWRILDSGRPIDTETTLFDGTELDGPVSLRAALLTRQDAFLRNFTGQLLSYSLGRSLQAFDMPTVRAIVSEAGDNGNRFSSFVWGVLKSPAFRMRRAESTFVAEDNN